MIRGLDTPGKRGAWIVTFVLVGLMALAGMTGCSNPPKRGQVTDRWFRPEHYNDWVSFVCVSYGKNGTCTNNIMVYHHDRVAPRWQLRVVKDYDDMTKTDKAGWWDTDAVGYANCTPGTHYPECEARH